MKNLMTLESFQLENNLVDYLSDEFIENYYIKNYKTSITDILEIYPDAVFNNIDDEKFISDFIDDEVSNTEIDYFGYDEDDLKSFIINNLSDNKKFKILEIWKDKYGDENNLNLISNVSGLVTKIYNDDYDNLTIEITKNNNKIKKYIIPENHNLLVSLNDTIKVGDTLSEIYFDEYMLEEFDEEELIEVIKYDNEEEEFIEEELKRRYEYRTAKDILEEIYDISLNSVNVYNAIKNYIDEDEIIKRFIDDEDFDYKKEILSNDISSSPELQFKILKSDNSSVFKLAELFIEYPEHNNISYTYDFQKKYIKQYVISNNGKEKKDILIAMAIKELDNNFELNDDIKEEYSKYLWMSSSYKFNI